MEADASRDTRELTLMSECSASLTASELGKDGPNFRIENNDVGAFFHALIVLAALKVLEIRALVFRAEFIGR